MLLHKTIILQKHYYQKMSR